MDEMENKPNLKRPKTVKSEFHIHESTSEMHRAISMRDREWIKNLLKKGETLCNGVDLSPKHGTGTPNCFILAHSVGTSGLLKFLLSVNPEAAITARNNDGLTLLMLYAKEHDLKEVKAMLDLGTDPDICSNDGNTALMWAMSKLTVYFEKVPYDHMVAYLYEKFNKKRQSNAKMCQQIMDLLFQRGADADICNVKGENVLHIAVKNQYSFHLDILHNLIHAGIDPTVETRERCTVLSYAMETFAKICSQYRTKDAVAKDAYKALHYLYNLVPFRSDEFQLRCSFDKQPQTILLKHLSSCQIITGNQAIFDDFIVSKKNLFDPRLVTLDYIQNTNNSNQDHTLIEDAEFSFGLLAMNLNHERFLDSTWSAKEMSRFGDTLLENMQYLTSIGFIANIPGTISPLTVGLLHRYRHFDYVTFARTMLDSGVHVEQRMLEYSVHDQELERLSAELCLPDVLRVSLSQAHLDPEDTLELVKMFLPHFAHPGLTLLPFTTPEKVATLFPYLSSCGALHHSALHTTLQQLILDSGWLSEEHLCIFNQMNECIPSLQALCRTVVRAHLAPRASQHGNNLPGLIKSIPPLTTVSKNHLVNVASFLE